MDILSNQWSSSNIGTTAQSETGEIERWTKLDEGKSPEDVVWKQVWALCGLWRQSFR